MQRFFFSIEKEIDLNRSISCPLFCDHIGMVDKKIVLHAEVDICLMIE